MIKNVIYYFRDWNVCVAVGIIRSNKNNRNFIRVTGEEKGNILERIKHVLSSRGLMVNLKVEVKPVTTFLLSNQTKYMIDTMETNGNTFSPLYNFIN